MANTKQTSFKNTDVISASEIGQYYFCSTAWHLQKCGYKPQSALLQVGEEKHKELGRIIEYTQRDYKKSRVFATLGYLLLFFAILFFVFEVIL